MATALGRISSSSVGKCAIVGDWNRRIMQHALSGQCEAALRIFADMQEQGCVPDAQTYVAALKACKGIACLSRGAAIHAELAGKGHERNVYVASSLVDMYAKCGNMASARVFFHRMLKNNTNSMNVVCWNAMITGYVQNGDGESALQLFDFMIQQQQQQENNRVVPNARTYVAAFKACATLATSSSSSSSNTKQQIILKKVREIHSQLAESGSGSFDVTDIFVANTLVDTYAKCGSLVDARAVFERSQSRNVVSWNALIMGYSQSGEAETALKLFFLMKQQQQEKCVPDARTYLAAFKACSSMAAKDAATALKIGKQIHQELDDDDLMDEFVASGLVDMYAKCGNMIDAQQMFNSLSRTNICKVVWNALIAGYTQNGDGEAALQCYNLMLKSGCAPNATTFSAALKACATLAVREADEDQFTEGVPSLWLITGKSIFAQAAAAGFESDLSVANTAVDLFFKCGSSGDARRVFDRIAERSVVSWNALILGYSQCGEGEIGVEMFLRMKQEESLIHPDAVTYVAALKACGNAGAVEIGRKIHAEIAALGLLHREIAVACALIACYGRCGSMIEAEGVFDSIDPERRDSAIWNALLAGYSQIGDAANAIQCFKKMQQDDCVQPDGVTFLELLTALSRAGFVDTGRECFEKMSKRGPEHYACMVDLLGRAGDLQAAVAMVEDLCSRSIEIGDGSSKYAARCWFTVLGACRKWGNVALGRLAFERVVMLQAKDRCAAYFLMANLYASAGMWEESSMIDARRKSAGF